MATIDQSPALHSVISDIAVDILDPRLCPRGEALLYDKAYIQGVFYLVEPLNILGQGPKSQTFVAPEQNEDLAIRIYPNPASNLVNIEFGANDISGDKQIRIYDFLGNLVFTSQVLSDVLLTIDIADFPSGMYLITITSDEEILMKEKLIVN